MNSFYLTTSIAYPNADPHIGYALELVQADFLARYYRLQGKSVYFLTGTDEHGLKLQRSAEKAGTPVENFVEEKAAVFRQLTKLMGISQDRFIRTTDSDHVVMAQALWRLCLAKGDIYKKKYRAWYNVKDEEFLGQVEDGDDPKGFGIDPQFIEMIDEENYFFRLSRYRDEILSVLRSEEYKVLPKGRLQEVINFVESKGLQDISISREVSKLSWGIPVPDDSSQVMYVWFDALTNYLTPAFKVDDRGMLHNNGLWPAQLHCIGKDITRFHALIWTGMLISAGLALPRELLVHGFFNSAGQKMSKSLGNVVDPFLEVQKFGQDGVRWYLLKEMPTTGDADYTEQRVEQVVRADLANDLGNLVSRVWSMCSKYCQGKVPTQAIPEKAPTLDEEWVAYHKCVQDRKLDEALKVAHGLMVGCNQQIEEKKPWQMAKDEELKNSLGQFLYDLLETIRQIAIMIQPALLVSSQKIATELFSAVGPAYWLSFEKARQIGVLIPGTALGEKQLILFPRDEQK